MTRSGRLSARIPGLIIPVDAGAMTSGAGAGVLIGLGDLPGGEFSSSAYAMSPDGGTIVGVSETLVGRMDGFVWDAKSRTMSTVADDRPRPELTVLPYGVASGARAMIRTTDR